MAHKAPVPSALVLPPPADAELFWVTCSSVLVPVLAGYFLPPGFCCVHPVHSLSAFSVSTNSWSPFALGHRVFPVDSKRVRTKQRPPFSLGTNKNKPFQYFSPLTP